MAYDVTKQTTVGQLKALAEATKQELDKKQDAETATGGNVATDEEVNEMLAEVFGSTTTENGTEEQG